jgi:DNA-binding transcriptional LysR family regulator
VREVEPRPGLRLETILVEPALAVLAAGHPLALKPAVNLSDLADEPFVLWRRSGSPEFFDRLTAACRTAGFSPRVVYEARGIRRARVSSRQDSASRSKPPPTRNPATTACGSSVSPKPRSPLESS